MRSRYLLLATIAGTVVMFAWQAVSNAAIPWHRATMHVFADDSAAAHAVRAIAPTNGVWVSHRGVIATVAITPTFADLATGAVVGGMLGRQAVLDLFVTFVLVLLIGRTAATGALGAATTATLAALSVATVVSLSNWIWYGFTFPFELVNLVEQLIAYFLAGLTIGALRKRYDPITADTAERRGVAGGAYASRRTAVGTAASTRIGE